MHNKFTFAGCSLTYGQGLETLDQRYAQLVSNHFNAEMRNVAVPGNTNDRIFITSLKEILFNTPDIMFVQWSSFIRKIITPKPKYELGIFPNVEIHEWFLKDLDISRKDMETYKKVHFMLENDYHNFFEIVDYCNILEEAAKDKCKIVFINGLLPWTEEISNVSKITNLGRELSDYTKDLLNFDNEAEDKVWSNLNNLGVKINTLNKDLWCNMFNSLVIEAIDYGTDNMHPGPNSQEHFAKKIIEFIE